MRAELREIIQSMSDEVTVAGGRFAHYGGVLRDFNEILDGDAEPSTLSSSVDLVINETDLTEDSRRALEDRLNLVLNEVEVLKHNLEEIREEALTDALTGIPNRKAFDAALDRAMVKARETTAPLSTILVDIDHFKQFNDTHGHLVGDKVLRYVASKIRHCLKGKDFPSRFGGEEFAIILPETDLRGAETVAEQIRGTISSGDLKSRSSGERLGKITVSAGVAQLRNSDNTTDLIRRVDAALYSAKNRGRNRIERERP
jgi:diguanylate cyclase